MLREELDIKDERWERSPSRRRPHYTPIQRMRILQIRAARGWTLDKTARVFLLDEQTLMEWMSRLDETGGTLVQTANPVNRYPDYVRCLVRQLKTLFPRMGSLRIAQTLGRIGLQLAATTVRRIVREKNGPLIHAPAGAVGAPRRRVVAPYPGHTWHLDLTTVPIRSGLWVPWLPLSLSQRWPFAWCVAVVVDQCSRVLIGFAVFHAPPDSRQVQQFLERAIAACGQAPRYILTDHGSQFDCRPFKRWAKRQGIRPRYGKLGEFAGICVVERFIRSLKQECTRRLTLVPFSHGAMRRELELYARWYNRERPHTHLAGRTPQQAFDGLLAPRRRFEPRLRMPSRGATRCGRLELVVECLGGRQHLPVVVLKRVA